jgi:AraC family transcriptional regulator
MDTGKASLRENSVIDEFELEDLATTVTSSRGDSTSRLRSHRNRLLDLSVALVEDFRQAGTSPEPAPESFCDVFQVCLPYDGLFAWHVAGDEVVGDANQAIYVRAGEAYRTTALVRSGFAELVITPDLSVLADIAGTAEHRLFDHLLFRRRSWLATPSLLMIRARFLHAATGTGDIDVLEAEEAVVALLRAAFHHDTGQRDACSRKTGQFLRRAKEFMQTHMAERIRLIEISRAAGLSPAYLTDVFKRVEGRSLHQYLTQLRLGRALLHLPFADDLTALALETGFSSHSHFSAAFRRAFRVTPSQFRQAGRGGLNRRATVALDRTA